MKMRIILFTFIALITSLAHAIDLNPTTIPPDSVGYSAERIMNTSLQPTPSVSDVKWRFLCTNAKVGKFDPIVSPGQAVAGHWHTFFGNTGVNPNSTANSIATTGNSTCAGGTLMRSSYWMPSLYDTATGKYIESRGALIYYATGTSKPEAQKVTHELPAGLVMINGDKNNSSPNTVDFNNSKIYYKCYANGTESPKSRSIPNCPAGGSIEVNFSFRNCWDGVHLDSPDHKSHMAYSGNYPAPSYCPATHPIRVASINMLLFFDITEGNASTWRLSSDMYDPTLPGGYSMHADFMNGGSPYVKKMMVDNCFIAGMDCSVGLLGQDPVDGQFKRLY